MALGPNKSELVAEFWLAENRLVFAAVLKLNHLIVQLEVQLQNKCVCCVRLLYAFVFVFVLRLCNC